MLWPAVLLYMPTGILLTGIAMDAVMLWVHRLRPAITQLAQLE